MHRRGIVIFRGSKLLLITVLAGAVCQNAVAVTLPGQGSVTEQEGAVDQVLAFYRAGKTQRVIGELESCYLKPPNGDNDICVFQDIAARYIETKAAELSGDQLPAYFSDLPFNLRLSKALIQEKKLSEQAAGELVKASSSAIVETINRRLTGKQ